MNEFGKSLEEIIQQRLKSKNAFIPNAGPPDYKRSRKPAAQVRGIAQEPPEQPTLHLSSMDQHSSVTIQKPAQYEEQIQKRDQFEEIIPTIQKHSIPTPITPPYTKGDNIFLELITYYQSDKVENEKSTAVIDEEHNCLLATVAAASKLSYIIEGPSRSGKSLIADKLGKLLTGVYKVEICSNKALFADADEINKNDFIYISEFQAALESNPDVKETIKLLTEHKSATNKANGRTQTIKGDITVISTGADENLRTQKRDVEVSGRFILLRTKSDQEKIRKIADYQDKILMGEKNETNFSKERYHRLKSHVKNILNSDCSYENPFAKAYANWLPETQKSIYYRTLFTSLINGFTKFDSPNRVRKEDKLLTHLSDLYLVHTLYHTSYAEALKKLTLHSHHSLEKSLSEIERKEKETAMEKELSLIETALNTPVNWQEIWNAGYNHVKERNYLHLEDWVELQRKENDIVIYDPIKKQDISLCKLI